MECFGLTRSARGLGQRPPERAAGSFTPVPDDTEWRLGRHWDYGIDESTLEGIPPRRRAERSDADSNERPGLECGHHDGGGLSWRRQPSLASQAELILTMTTRAPSDLQAQAQLRASLDRYAWWVAMWREGVRSAHSPMGLVDLSTTRFIELSLGAAKLLGTTPDGGSGLTHVLVAGRPSEVEETARLMREGMLDGLRAHRRFRGC